MKYFISKSIWWHKILSHKKLHFLKYLIHCIACFVFIFPYLHQKSIFINFPYFYEGPPPWLLTLPEFFLEFRVSRLAKTHSQIFLKTLFLKGFLSITGCPHWFNHTKITGTTLVTETNYNMKLATELWLLII